MADASARGRWPYPTDGPSRETTSFETSRSPAATVVRNVAEVIDTDPLDLSTLNERIDPDVLDSLVTGRRARSSEGVRVAIEVSFEEVTGVICDDGRLEVYTDGQEPNQMEAPAAADHDWTGPDPLTSSIGATVADSADGTPTTVMERLSKQLDADAVERALRPGLDGDERTGSRLLVSVAGHEVAVEPDGTITVEPSLGVLRRAGAALLVVGSMPEDGIDRAASTFLGDPAAGRSPLFVLHGRDLETAERRLSMAGVAPSDGTVVDHQATARSAAATAGDAQSEQDGLAVVPVSGQIDAIPPVVRETIEDGPSRSPGELRVCVDSLDSMIDSSDLETSRAVVEEISEMVRSRKGIAHVILPEALGSERVERLAPSFDAIIELRPVDCAVEQRWHVLGTGHETSWFPLE